MPGNEARRWGICFAVVMAAHGAAALGILLSPSLDSEFGVDVPVVTIELPHSMDRPDDG